MLKLSTQLAIINTTAENYNLHKNWFKKILLTDTKYGPAKSRITPCMVQMPMCPMKGINHLYSTQYQLLLM